MSDRGRPLGFDSAIFGEADQVEVVIMVRQNGFGFVAEIEEELNVSGRTQHGAGVNFMGIGRHSLNLADQRFPNPSRLRRRTHGEQPNHADAGHRPKAHGADNLSVRLGHEDMFLSRIVFQTFEGFRRPSAQFVDAGIFAKRSLLHLEKSAKIDFGCRSDMNHDVDPGFVRDCPLHNGRRRDSQGRSTAFRQGRETTLEGAILFHQKT